MLPHHFVELTELRFPKAAGLLVSMVAIVGQVQDCGRALSKVVPLQRVVNGAPIHLMAQQTNVRELVVGPVHDHNLAGALEELAGGFLSGKVVVLERVPATKESAREPLWVPVQQVAAPHGAAGMAYHKKLDAEVVSQLGQPTHNVLHPRGKHALP